MPPLDDDTRSLTFDFPSGNRTIINLDSDLESISDGEVSENELEDSFATPAPSNAGRTLNERAALEANYREVPSLKCDGFTLRPGKSVELRNGSFLHILAIFENRSTWQVHLRGSRFRRTLELHGMLELKQNELVMLLGSSPTAEDNYSEIIEASEVLRVRDLILTNQSLPTLSYRELDLGITRREDIRDKCRLVCRWMWCRKINGETFLCSFNFDHSDTGARVSDQELKSRFRGHTIRGGMCPDWLPG